MKHFLTRRLLRRRWGLGVIIALVAVFANAPNALACNISANGCGGTGLGTGCGYSQYAGGSWDSQGSPGWPWVNAGTITSYNPSPVWSQSSAWVMLTNNSYSGCHAGCYAQVGWNHWYSCQALPSGSGPGGGGTCATDGHEHVFVEWTLNTGGLQPIYYYNIPSGSTERFSVIKSGTNGYFYLDWSEGSTTTPSTVNWGPAGINTSEEVNDYDGGCCNHGSQFGGDSTTNVQFSNLL